MTKSIIYNVKGWQSLTAIKTDVSEEQIYNQYKTSKNVDV